MTKNLLSLDFIIFITMSMGALFMGPVTIGQVIILCLIFFIYLRIDYALLINSAGLQKIGHYKIYLLIITLILIVAPALASKINEGNQIYVHDNVQQLEAATEFLMNGQNPYEQNYAPFFIDNEYIGTTTGKKLPNPAIEHVITLPGHILLSVPVYLTSKLIFDFYDQRLLYFIAYFITVLILILIPNKLKNKIILGSLFALNPLILKFFYEGRNDILLLCFIIASIYLLIKQRPRLASLMLGLALTIKHFAFILLPFFVAYYYWQMPPNLKWNDKLWGLFKKIWPMPIVWLIINLPFIIWNTQAFYQDTIAYPLGLTAASYPVSGFGFSAWLEIHNIELFLPLWLIQVVVSGAVLYFLLKLQKKINAAAILVLNFTILLFVFLILSRFFNDNYISFIVQLLMVTYFINHGDQKIARENVL